MAKVSKEILFHLGTRRKRLNSEQLLKHQATLFEACEKKTCPFQDVAPMMGPEELLKNSLLRRGGLDQGVNIPAINRAITLKPISTARVCTLLLLPLPLRFRFKCFTYRLEWITNKLPSEWRENYCCWERGCFCCTETHLISVCAVEIS